MSSNPASACCDSWTRLRARLTKTPSLVRSTWWTWLARSARDRPRPQEIDSGSVIVHGHDAQVCTGKFIWLSRTCNFCKEYLLKCYKTRFHTLVFIDVQWWDLLESFSGLFVCSMYNSWCLFLSVCLCCGVLSNPVTSMHEVINLVNTW